MGLDKNKSKHVDISEYQSQINCLTTDYNELEIAYTNIHAQIEAVLDMYPDHSYTITSKMDDKLWKGNGRNTFEYEFESEYGSSLSALITDSLDARDWIAYEMESIQDRIGSLKRKIKKLKS